jgi:hypothetical protein
MAASRLGNRAARAIGVGADGVEVGVFEARSRLAPSVAGEPVATALCIPVHLSVAGVSGSERLGEANGHKNDSENAREPQ